MVETIKVYGVTSPKLDQYLNALGNKVIYISPCWGNGSSIVCETKEELPMIWRIWILGLVKPFLPGPIHFVVTPATPPETKRFSHSLVDLGSERVLQ